MFEKTLYLVRHAQPDTPAGEQLCLGQTLDLPLSASGLSQARALGRFFCGLGVEAVYTSPLLRARQTAACIAGDAAAPRVLDSLIELSGGEWDGLSFDLIRARYPEYFGPSPRRSCPPGGERDAQGLARARAALAYVAQRTDRCAVMVAHAGLNRLLLCALLGRPLDEKKRIPQGYAAVNTLRYVEGAWHVLQVDGGPARPSEPAAEGVPGPAGGGEARE